MALIPRAPLVTPTQSLSVQQPQGFPNNSGLYTTAAVLALGTALMAQVNAPVQVQQPQRFANPLSLYVPAPFGAQVLARPSAIAVQQPQPFGNLLSLYSAPATIPPLGKPLFDVRIGPPQVQPPQPFPNTFGLYTTLAYIPASAQVPAQVVFVPRWAQTTPTAAFVQYTTTYQWPSTVVSAQINRAQTQPANVAGAPLTLYSATYTPPSAQRFDVPPTRSVQQQGFAQSAQIGLYQPQVYKPPQAPHFESPRVLPYSFAYQGFAHAARLSLYTTLPITTDIDSSRRLSVTLDNRVLAVHEQERILSADLTQRLVQDDGESRSIEVASNGTIH